MDTPTPKSSAEMKTSFRSKPKEMTNLYFFQQNCFSSRHSLDTRNTVMTTFANNSQKFVFFSVQSPKKRKKFLHSSANRIFLRVFCGHKKCSFGFSAGIVSRKTELLFGSTWKTNRSNVSYSRKTVFSENVNRTRTKQFWHFWWQSFCCNQFFFCSIPKTDKSVCFSAKRFFPKLFADQKKHFWKHCLVFLC